MRKLDAVLCYGVNPNTLFSESTIWVTYLNWILEATSSWGQKKGYFEILDILLVLDADWRIFYKMLIRGIWGKRKGCGNFWLYNYSGGYKGVLRDAGSQENPKSRRRGGVAIFYIFLFTWLWLMLPIENANSTYSTSKRVCLTAFHYCIGL
jgi:hypothetical protein